MEMSFFTNDDVQTVAKPFKAYAKSLPPKYVNKKNVSKCCQNHNKSDQQLSMHILAKSSHSETKVVLKPAPNYGEIT